MSIIEFSQMIDVDVSKYEKILDAFYLQKIINLQYLDTGSEMTDKTLKVINEWYKKEKYKCLCAKN